MDAGLEALLQCCPGIVYAWLEEENIDIKKIKSLSIGNDVVRDYEREEAEDSKWCYWKPGKTMTVIVVDDLTTREKNFDRQAWEESVKKKSRG